MLALGIPDRGVAIASDQRREAALPQGAETQRTDAHPYVSAAAAYRAANKMPVSTMANTIKILPIRSLVEVMRASARTRISLCGLSC